LAVDVDGTLITDHGEITEKVHRALENAGAAGWETIIATGRTLYAARRIIESLPFIRYALLSNGSCIVNIRESNIMHQDTIPPDVVGEVVEVVRRNGAVPVLYDTDIYNQRLYYDTTEGACDFFVWYVNTDRRSTRVPDIMAHTGNVQQIGSIAPRDTIFRIREEVAALRAVPMTLPFESPHFGGKNHEYWFLQVIPAGISKIVAIRKMAEWLRIPDGRIVAVGDNYNDADMIEGADVGVAMGNAPEEIKRLARLVVGTNNDSGLAEVVEKVILSKEYFTII
jgi:Cof subfamily protein (haloacid dehalogenase superfamily)